MLKTEINQLVGLLRQFEPGYLPYPIFEEIARLTVMPIIEFVPLTIIENEVNVLLIRRDKDDPLWPNLLHTPGTVLRTTDYEENPKNRKQWAPFQRIIIDELKSASVGLPYYVGSIFHKSKRGIEQAQVYWLEVVSNPNVGEFYNVTQLPKCLIESQYIFIQEAVKHYYRYKK